MRLIDADVALSMARYVEVDGGIAYVVPVKDIKALPTIQPETKRGRWLINSDGYYPYCSACMAEPESGVMTDYCPSCGANMRGE